MVIIITAIIAIVSTIFIAIYEMRQISLLSGQQQKSKKQAHNNQTNKQTNKQRRLTVLITLSMPASCAMMGAEMRSGTPIPAIFFTIPFNTYHKERERER